MPTVEAKLKTLAALAALLLASCGGSGSSPTDTNVPPVPAGTPSTVNYISATPPVITLSFAASGDKSAVMRFIVKDAVGNPVADGTVVNFVLTGPSGGKLPSNGGEYLSPPGSLPTASSTTTLGGVAETQLVSGAVAGPATVTATVAAYPSVTTVSAPISIGGGVPAQNHFRLAATRLNLAPTAGTFITVGAYLSDRWGNPQGLVGTAVSFFAEDGSTQPISLTDEFGQAFADFTLGAGLPTNGRITIMAATQGEEQFTDTNGNGLYNTGEPIVDMPEPFLDKNESGAYNPGTPPNFLDAELYIDVNGNGQYSGPNGMWDGPNCPAVGCVKPATIWTSLTLTISTSANCAAGISPATFAIAAGGSQAFTFTVQDLNGNSVLGGTVVTVTETGDGVLSGTLSATISNGATGPAILNFTLTDSVPLEPGPPVAPTPATVTVAVTPPASSGLAGCSATSTGTVD